MNYRRLYSHSKDKDQGVLYDQTIMLNNFYTVKDYPAKLRLIKFRDDQTSKLFIFLTNNFRLKATDTTLLQQHRWKIELFFIPIDFYGWIKTCL